MADTKYGHLINDHDWTDSEDDDSSESETSRVTLKHQTIRVLWAADPDLEYQVVISHGTHDWEPICTHVGRAHRLADSNQFDPMGAVDWTDIPQPVQERVVDVVAGVDAVCELDPEHEIGFETEDGDSA